MEYFNVAPEHQLVAKGRQPYELEGRIEVNDLSYVVADGTQLLSEIDFDLKHGEHMALVGFSGSGKSTLAQCIAQLYKYTGGKIFIDQEEVSQLSKEDITHNVGFVSQTPFIFEGSIDENLQYAFMAKAEKEQSGKKTKIPSLDDRILVLQQTGLFTDVLRFGLNAVLDKDKHEDMIKHILDVRKTFRHDFGEDLAEFIEFYDPGNYLYYSSVAENILFGDPLENGFKAKNLPQNEIFNAVLAEAALREQLLDTGVSFIDELIKFLDQRSSDEEKLEIGLIDPDEIDNCKRLCYKVKKKGIQKLSNKERNKILRLMLGFIPQKYPFFDLPKKLENQILEGRTLFKEKISAAAPDAVSFYHMSNYMHTQSILTNIFYGKLKEESSAVQEKVNTCIHQLLIWEDFLEDIIEMGMQHSVGTKGDNLSGGQRQKLAIARIFLKKPPVMILDEATSGLDNESQARIQNMLETQWKGKSTLIAVVHRLDIIKNYDSVAVMKGGKIIEMGKYDELMDKQGTLFELIAG
jgi:ABC-type multidrug transport system ATPase subunit